MLDLEVVPERSLGNEQWEFILGEISGCQMSQIYAKRKQNNWVLHNA